MEVRTRIFDPYFTTRPGANGLGLATTHSIPPEARGRITVDLISAAARRSTSTSR